jgi:predicted GIY-YIG superfamily endonuclease
MPGDLGRGMRVIIYTGITDDLMRRIYEHKQEVVKGFTSKTNRLKSLFLCLPSPNSAVQPGRLVQADHPAG